MAALLDVDHGFETAVAAALGTAADAVVVDDAAAALAAIAHLKADDLGRAGLLLGGAPLDDRDWPTLPDDATYAVDVVTRARRRTPGAAAAARARSPSSTTSPPRGAWSSSSPTWWP